MAKNDVILMGAELDAAYQKYSSSYNNKAKELKNKYSIKMFDTKLSKLEFQSFYAAFAHDIMEEKKWNSVNDKVVIRAIINRQATELSEEQAEAFQKGMAKQGKHYTMKEIYQGGADKIREMDEALKAQGKDSAERKSIIATAIFGSP